MPKKTNIHSDKLRSVSNIGYLVHTHDSSCLETKDRKSFNYSNKNEKLMRLVELWVRCHSKKVSRYDAIIRQDKDNYLRNWDTGFKEKAMPCFATLFNHVANKSREIFASSIHQLEVQERRASSQCCNSRTWSLVQGSRLAESLEWKLSRKL